MLEIYILCHDLYTLHIKRTMTRIPLANLARRRTREEVIRIYLMEIKFA